MLDCHEIHESLHGKACACEACQKLIFKKIAAHNNNVEDKKIQPKGNALRRQVNVTLVLMALLYLNCLRVVETKRISVLELGPSATNVKLHKAKTNLTNRYFKSIQLTANNNNFNNLTASLNGILPSLLNVDNDTMLLNDSSLRYRRQLCKCIFILSASNDFYFYFV